MKTFIALCAISLIFASCESDDDQAPPSDLNPKNELRLNDLKVGQSNRFLAFKDFCFPTDFFEYTGDTLLVEVVSMGSGIGIRESFTPGSTNHSESQPVTYAVVKRDGYLLLPERQTSQLFYFFGNDTLPVAKSHSVSLQQGECYIEYQNNEPFIGEEVGLISPFELGDRQYFDKRVVSCVPPFMNMDGYLVYDSKQLFVSMTILPGLDMLPVDGFIMIPNE
jgi:hypothetical protein